MADLSKINNVLKDHERRLAALENKKSSTKKLRSHKSLSDYIIELRDRGAFRKAITADEVHKKLEAIYPCELARVKVELLRVQKRRQLRKASKVVGKKEYVAYVW